MKYLYYVEILARVLADPRRERFVHKHREIVPTKIEMQSDGSYKITYDVFTVMAHATRVQACWERVSDLDALKDWMKHYT